MTIMKNFLKIMPVCIMAMLACSCDKDEEAVDGAYYVSLDEEFVIKYNTDITLCNGQKPQELQWITDMLRAETKNETWKECKHSKKCTFYTLRFGCSFAAVNTIKPQLL